MSLAVALGAVSGVSLSHRARRLAKLKVRQPREAWAAAAAAGRTKVAG